MHVCGSGLVRLVAALDRCDVAVISVAPSHILAMDRCRPVTALVMIPDEEAVPGCDMCVCLPCCKGGWRYASQVRTYVPPACPSYAPCDVALTYKAVHTKFTYSPECRDEAPMYVHNGNTQICSQRPCMAGLLSMLLFCVLPLMLSTVHMVTGSQR